MPINTRFRAREAAYTSGGAACAALFTVRGFLDTDYPALLAAPASRSRLEHTILLAGDAR